MLAICRIHVFWLGLNLFRYAAHPEWFWPRDNPTVYGQLCWSNSSLQTFVLETVRKILRTQPHANIVSVSQNDNGHYCQSAAEMAIINAEGILGSGFGVDRSPRRFTRDMTN